MFRLISSGVIYETEFWKPFLCNVTTLLQDLISMLYDGCYKCGSIKFCYFIDWTHCSVIILSRMNPENIGAHVDMRHSSLWRKSMFNEKHVPEQDVCHRRLN